MPKAGKGMGEGTFEGRKAMMPIMKRLRGKGICAMACRTALGRNCREADEPPARDRREKVPCPDTHWETRWKTSGCRHGEDVRGRGAPTPLPGAAPKSVPPRAYLQRCSSKAHVGRAQRRPRRWCGTWPDMAWMAVQMSSQLMVQSAPFLPGQWSDSNAQEGRQCWPLRKAGKARDESGTSRNGRLRGCPAQQQRDFWQADWQDVGKDVRKATQLPAVALLEREGGD